MSDSDQSYYRFKIDGHLLPGYQYEHISGPPISVKRGRNSISLEEYFETDPPVIQYVDGSFSYNCFLIKVPEFIGEYSRGMIDVWNWGGIDIRKESMGKECSRNSIQWKVFNEIRDEYEIIINDDGPGEAADLIAVKMKDNKVFLHLFHCKFSSDDATGARIKDLYELCGQAQKSIRWKHSKFESLYTHIKRRDEKWSPHTRFLKGSMSALSTIKNRSRTTQVVLEVTIVQPGVSRERISPNMLKIIGTTEHYLMDTANSPLRVVGSA